MRRFLLTCVLLLPSPLAAQQVPDTSRRVLNLDFELNPLGRPYGWLVAGPREATVTLDSVEVAFGRRSLRMERPTGMSGASIASQVIPRDFAAGRRIRFSGHIRTEGVTNGPAGLWLRVEGEGARQDDLAGRAPSGTTPWKRYEVEMAIPPCADEVSVGMRFPGTGTVWFDSLGIELLDPPAPGPFRVCGEPEAAEWIDWTRQHAVPLASLTSSDFTDLAFLRPLLAGKRVVQLGESGHGVADFNQVKVRLIRFLHEEMGYDVIAFESSVYECFQAYRAIATLLADVLMRRCIFPVWHAEEVLPLFEYIKATQHTTRPLILAGFDTQVGSGSMGMLGRAEMFHALIQPVDSAFAARVQQMDWRFQWASMQEHADSFIAGYSAITRFFDDNRGALLAASRHDTALVQVARQTAWSMVRFIEQIQEGAATAVGTAARDSGMAANLDFLLDELYPGRKIITWGHNFHLRHRNDGVTPNPMRTMGSWVSERRRAEVYTVGLYMHHGRAAFNHRQVYDVEVPWAGSCESILGSATGDYLFLDMSQVSRTPGSDWLFNPILCREWGIQNQRLVPRDQYDALLLIRESRPPTYLTR